MKKILLVLLLLSQITFYSCSDEKGITNYIIEKDEIGMIAEKLQKLIDDNNITVAHVYFFDITNNSWISEGGCNDFEVSSPFINVCGTYYYLGNLVKFDYDVSLNLYFKY